jgi:WD40 repeat protein
VNDLSPYKGLAPFEDSDADARFFFGRSREEGIVTANLTAARLTLLYGLSGVGKSSILKAGVVRRLRALPGPLAVVVFDRWRDDPGQRLREAVAAAAGGKPEGSLADTLEAASAHLGGELYVILDGAEEYFLYHGAEDEPGTFAADFPDAVMRPGLRAFFLLSLREDSLAALDRLKPRVPQMFANSFRLEHLDRRAAEEAIVGPIARYNELSPDGSVEIEPALTAAVIDQVATGKLDLGGGRGIVDGDTGGQVETPYLSLVMERLWDAERAASSRVLRLATLEALGGAEQIVRDHLDDALAALPPGSQEAAAEVFSHLVTRSGTKIAHSVEDLADYAGVDEGELAPVLRALAAERILRPVAGANGSARYEIFHDVLAGAVVAWRSGYETRRALERERARNRRRVRRLLVVIALALVALAAMSAITIFALTQRRIALARQRLAQSERSAARSEARRADARLLAVNGLAQIPRDPELSLLLGLEAVRREPTPEVEELLRQALVASHVRAVLPAGGKPVNDIAFSPDGRLLAVGGADGILRVFTARGKQRRRFPRVGEITSVAFHPGGALVMAAGKDGVARVWRLKDGHLVHALRHSDDVRSAEFSPDGTLIVTAGDDRAARIWQTEDGSLLHSLAHEAGVRRALFNADESLVATVSGGDTRVFAVASGALVLAREGQTSPAFTATGYGLATSDAESITRIWDTRTGFLREQFPAARGRVVSSAFSPRGELVLTASTDGAARVWSIATEARTVIIRAHTGALTSASFNPTGPGEPAGKWVLTSGRNGRADVSATDSGTTLADLRGHRGTVTDAEFSPDGSLVATAGVDGTARIWDARTHPDLRTIGRHRGPALSVSFSPHSRFFVSAGADGTARVWRTSTRRLFAALPHGGRVNDASFAPGGKLLVTAGSDGTARLWTVRGVLKHVWRHRGPVRTAAFSRDGQLVVTASADRTARVWRVADGAAVRTLRHRRPVLVASFSPDGTSVLTTSADRKARIWSSGGALRHVLSGHRSRIVGASFSPDGTQVVTASADRTARLWDVASGRKRRTLRGHRQALTSASFSPRGDFVITTSRDGDARLWDLAARREGRVLSGHFGVVSGASFSGDGRWIVTAGPIAAGLWSTSSRERVALLSGSGNRLRSASFSPDGRWIVAAGAGGSVRTYRCELCGTLEELVRIARARVAATGRRLTPAERAEYVRG